MNKYQEALNYIKNIVLDSSGDGYYEPKTVQDFYFRDCQILQELINKATPQKPSIEDDTWYCPECEAEYELDYHEHDYCPKCGQALDWSEEDE